jgi:hypothetical protein
MRASFSSTLVATLMLAVPGCGEGPTDPSEGPGIELVAAGATNDKATATTHVEIPLDDSPRIFQCADGTEHTFRVYGMIRGTVRQTADADGTVRTSAKWLGHGLVAYDELGRRYRGSDALHSSFDNTDAGLIHVEDLRFIGQGQAPNFRMHVVVHRTVNANGDVTADISETRITCD